MVKLSIVIPYYKTYELTVRLLDVLIPQLTKEVEVFLVDDGCNEFRLDEFEDKISIEHLSENKGGAYACNVGIRKAKGKYVAFIDSDDMISNEYIKILLKAINEHDEDVIIFNWKDINTGEVVKHPQNYATWKAIYKREIVPMFRDGWRYSYDVPFQEDLGTDYSRYYLDEILYYYNSNREGNLTTQKEKIRRESMIRCEVIEKFTLEQFDKLENIERKALDTKGTLYVGDTFDCDKDMVEYLTGNNPIKKVVVKVIEVKPKKEEKKEVLIYCGDETTPPEYKEVKIKPKKKKVSK